DAIVALRHELQHQWMVDVRVAHPDEIIPGPFDATSVDFFATTSFYGPLVHDAVANFNKPLLVLTIHGGLQDAIRRSLAANGLTVVAVDCRFEERIRGVYGSGLPLERVRFVAAHDKSRLQMIHRTEKVLL